VTDGRSAHIIQAYLDRVSREVDDLTPPEQSEIIEDLRAHIYEAVGDPQDASEADARNVLDRLGHPQDVAREARTRSPEHEEPSVSGPVQHEPRRTPGALEVAAIVLTALFWPVGVLLAWVSDRWITRDKVIATVIPFASTLLLGVIIIGGLVAYGTTTTVTVVEDQVQPAQPAEPAEPDERSPRQISDPSSPSEALSRFVIVLGFLGGVVAGPFISAVFLAIRMKPATTIKEGNSPNDQRGVPASSHI
jgi:uncharacterized membrane protein